MNASWKKAITPSAPDSNTCWLFYTFGYLVYPVWTKIFGKDRWVHHKSVFYLSEEVTSSPVCFHHYWSSCPCQPTQTASIDQLALGNTETCVLAEHRNAWPWLQNCTKSYVVMKNIGTSLRAGMVSPYHPLTGALPCSLMVIVCSNSSPFTAAFSPEHCSWLACLRACLLNSFYWSH